MEHRKTTTNQAACRRTHCSLCALCKAVNFEEQRTPAKQPKPEIKALYGAEALSYYFYFSPKQNATRTNEVIPVREAV